MTHSTEAAARRIIARMRSYAAPHTLMPVMASQFPHLDQRAYARFQARMEQEGFHYVADVEIPEVSSQMGNLMKPAMLRSISNGVATYYQVKPRLGKRLLLLAAGILNLRLIAAPRDFITGMGTRRCVDLVSELEDGRVLTTGNAETAAAITPPPNVERRTFPWGTPLATLLDAHRRRLDELLHEPAQPRAKAIRTLMDLIDLQKRQNARKIAHRAQIGIVTREEMRRMSRNPALADAVYADIERLLAREAGPRNPLPPTANEPMV